MLGKRTKEIVHIDVRVSVLHTVHVYMCVHLLRKHDRKRRECTVTTQWRRGCVTGGGGRAATFEEFSRVRCAHGQLSSVQAAVGIACERCFTALSRVRRGNGVYVHHKLVVEHSKVFNNTLSADECSFASNAYYLDIFMQWKVFVRRDVKKVKIFM